MTPFTSCPLVFIRPAPEACQDLLVTFAWDSVLRVLLGLIAGLRRRMSDRTPSTFYTAAIIFMILKREQGERGFFLSEGDTHRETAMRDLWWLSEPPS